MLSSSVKSSSKPTGLPVVWTVGTPVAFGATLFRLRNCDNAVDPNPGEAAAQYNVSA